MPLSDDRPAINPPPFRALEFRVAVRRAPCRELPKMQTDKSDSYAANRSAIFRVEMGQANLAALLHRCQQGRQATVAGGRVPYTTTAAVPPPPASTYWFFSRRCNQIQTEWTVAVCGSVPPRLPPISRRISAPANLCCGGGQEVFGSPPSLRRLGRAVSALPRAPLHDPPPLPLPSTRRAPAPRCSDNKARTSRRDAFFFSRGEARPRPFTGGHSGDLWSRAREEEGLDVPGGA